MSPPRGALRLAVAAVLLLGTAALADQRIVAKRHFQHGMQLIAAGKYDEGINELLEAYLIKPHANVLYNVAKAYQDAGRIPDAIEYYRRYLNARPPDAATVLATVNRLEASVAPAPRQEPPKIIVERPAPTDRASEEAAKRMAALLERLETAVAKAEERADSKVAAEPAEPERAGDGTVDALTAADAEAAPYDETVESASRRAQSSAEAPNATTIITAEDIRLSGATSLVELMRRVPGADVMALGVGSANVSFRGFNQRIANKVLVLLDGRTEYQDFLGMTLWSAIPVGLEEIERIEVIRGPGSALYGANAMLGVVNIITRRPGSQPRAQLGAVFGGGNTAGGSFTTSGGEEALRYRASAGYLQADKWSRDFPDDRADVAPQIEETALGLRTARGNLVAQYHFSPTVSVSASGGVNRIYTEIYPLGLLRNFFLDGTTHYLRTDLHAGGWKLKAFWNNLTSNAGPQYAAVGQEALRTRVEADVFNGEALYDLKLELAGTHHLGVGLEGRLKSVRWDYLGQPRSELHAAAFIQDEWRIVDPLRIVASYRIDRHPLLDRGQPGFAQSPRISAVWLPVEGHALRASYASAFREPTLLESYTRIAIPVPGVNGAAALSLGSTELRPEQLTAFELGYRGEHLPLGLEWDVALYQNEVRDLITLSAVSRLPPDQSYQDDTWLLGVSSFQNEPTVYTSRGVEVGARISPVDRLDVGLSGALQSISSPDPSAPCGPCTSVPGVKLHGRIAYRSKLGFDLSLDGGYTGETRWIEREPSTADPTRIEFVPNALAAFSTVNARIGYQVVPGKVELALVGSHLGPAHAEHPFGNRIERRFFATLQVTP